jgi:tripartite-type tricarboxylate transporter receptor subunit TctC
MPEDNMTLHRHRFLCLAAAAVALLGFSLNASAQSFPARPITMIVPYPPGGLFDVLARVLAEHMRKVLSQSVVIENIGGASGSIAIGRAARAAPDGYTIAIGSEDQFVVNAAIYPLQYDVVNDFEPVTGVIRGYSLVVGRKTRPAKDFKELVAWLKSNQANVAFAHNGAGGQLHRCGIAVQRAAGINSPFVPYRGAAPALQDVLGGRIDLMCASSASALPMVSGGLIRAFAFTGGARMAAIPDVPTVSEAGFPDLQLSLWGAVFAPKGTPKNIIGRLHAALADATANPEVRKRLTEIGLETFPREQEGPEALARLQRAEIEKWWPILRAANIKPE